LILVEAGVSTDVHDGVGHFGRGQRIFEVSSGDSYGVGDDDSAVFEGLLAVEVALSARAEGGEEKEGVGAHVFQVPSSTVRVSGSLM
jgi:hypothetical protein